MKIHIDLKQPGQPITPYWRVCVGGGRVGEALRADFQKHLEMVQREMPFQYIRMHGLFHEDMMVYHEENGQPIVNWQYVDLVYDHWLSSRHPWRRPGDPFGVLRICAGRGLVRLCSPHAAAAGD
jgi:hypothetical protein